MFSHTVFPHQLGPYGKVKTGYVEHEVKALSSTSPIAKGITLEDKATMGIGGTGFLVSLKGLATINLKVERIPVSPEEKVQRKANFHKGLGVFNRRFQRMISEDYGGDFLLLD